jgi:hypothetical protein
MHTQVLPQLIQPDSGIHSPAPQVATESSEWMYTQCLLRVSADSYLSEQQLDDGVDFFAVQGKRDRARLEAAK